MVQMLVGLRSGALLRVALHPDAHRAATPTPSAGDADMADADAPPRLTSTDGSKVAFQLKQVSMPHCLTPVLVKPVSNHRPWEDEYPS